MPVRDGLSALEELRSLPSTMHIPVVMLSASLIDQQRALDSGARFFLSKPYVGKELVAAVTAAIEKPSISED
jgi:CheY-like chemotaxis protein